MSELTQCNYCTWNSHKAYAKKRGEEIELTPSKEMLGWTAMVITDKKTGKKKEQGWFKEITDHCVC